MSSSRSESKLYNIYFCGDTKSSEKLFENLPEKKDLTKELEIHGEKINLNIIEHPDISIVSNEDKKANGILLFYNVTDVDSFNKLKEAIEKIIDMNKYEMPLIVVGNNPNNQERKVNEEEAKTFLEKYGIKYHEINNEENIKNIFNDLGEQVLYQDIVEKNEKENKNDENNNIKNNEENNKNEDENKNEENSVKSEETPVKNIDNEIKDKELEESITKTPAPKAPKDKKKSVIINKPFKPKIKPEQNDVKEKKTQAQIKREELVREKRLKRENEMRQWYKMKEREGIELKKKKEKESKIKLLEKVKEDKEIQKQKEKEVKEEFSNQKKERYEKSKKEREEEEKKSLLEKEKNKNILEKKLKSERANFRKLLLEKEQNEKESLEQKRAKIFSPSSSNNRFRPKKKSYEFDLENKSAILNNTISEFYIREEDENPKSKKVKNLRNSQNMPIKNYQTIKKHSTTINIFQTKKLKNNNKKRPNTLREGEKNKEKEKKEKVNEKENKLKNELEQNYLNNSEIYRCIFCSRIPLININQYDHIINLKCCCNNSYLNNNIYNYEYFTQKSLNHPILENNIICHYCQKKLSELKEENNMNIKYCDFCNFYICSKDDSMHNNYHSWIKHQEIFF